MLSASPAVEGTVGPGQVSVRASFIGSQGYTQVELPPLGRILAPTHAAPLVVRARVEQLDVDRLQNVLSGADPEARLRGDAADGIGSLARRFAGRAIVVAMLTGALLAAALPRRTRASVVAGALGGLVSVTLLLGATWREFDATAFDEARFEGPLERAPAILKTVRRHVEGFEDVRGRIENLGHQIADLYAASAGASPVGDATEVTLLHVSDIHSNPVGVEVTRQLAERFAVDAVLDTGDLTSFGLPIESRIGDLIATVNVPWLFVPGNHDSDANRQALAQVRNVKLLDRNVVRIGDVDILGIADPTFTAGTDVGAKEAAAVKRKDAARVDNIVRRLDPDVLAVHDPVLAGRAIENVPLVVAGHIHKRTAERVGDNWLLTVGTTGASGLGAFTVDTTLAYEAEVLRFLDGELVAVDYVSLTGVEGGFRVDRRLFRGAGT